MTYTADDFRTARFATHPNGLLAMRDHDITTHPWRWASRDRRYAYSDKELAAGGWSPVREAAPVSLDVLRTAWENAEQADKCRKGEVLIEHFGPDAYHVYLAGGNHLHLPRAIRILSSAWDSAVTTVSDRCRCPYQCPMTAIEAVLELHRPSRYYDHEDSCTSTDEDHRAERHVEFEVGEYYCEGLPTGEVVCESCRDDDGERVEYPCATRRAVEVVTSDG